MGYDFEILGKLAEAIGRLDESVGGRVAVGIDGCGGSGKSTLANALCRQLPNCQVIPTDDFASWEDPIEWWPRLMRQVFQPLNQGREARYQRYDWASRRLDNWVDVGGRILLIEGVTSTRREFRPFLAYRVWVECPRALRLERGLLRDGPDALANWQSWMAAEDEYVSDHQPRLNADFTICGGLGSTTAAPDTTRYP